MKLKVLAWNEKIFNEKYGNFFRATHANYDLQVISIIEHITAGEDLNQVVEKLIVSENPDVVSLNMDHYALLKEQNKLSSLSLLMKKDKFSTSSYTSAILDYFTDSQGQMYGLTPTFIGTSLYYNKKMFKERGISFPTDSMTWDEVFQLAQKFSTSVDSNNQQYGLYEKHFSNLFLMALYVGEGNGLSFFNNNKFLFHSASWENVFQKVTDCFKSRVCYVNDQASSSSQSTIESAEKINYPFLKGNIAMAVNDSSLYRILTSNNKRYHDLEWGIVSLPRSSEQPDLSNGVEMSEIFSITKNANVNASWEFIKYVCGDDYARLLPTVNPEELPARLPAEWQDERLKSFYNMERITNTTIQTLRSLPRPVITTIEEASEKFMLDVLSDKDTVSEALRVLELEIQTAFDGIEK
ncbi:ABC transporter substrate-binding protein [Cohnella abietis]|uniref:ABC transporter substrate-binding protein n=1 Tax=Cohnella abietis TaxID=2507935 RepID=A0A3T1D0P5_9BACL|nr:ABC transporter substrate-binding protein [Cohnella abietis]